MFTVTEKMKSESRIQESRILTSKEFLYLFDWQKSHQLVLLTSEYN
jgi:hypothetical protein